MIISAKIKVKFDFVCDKCGKVAHGDQQHAEVDGFSLNGLIDGIQRIQPKGTAFPVGWASFYRKDADYYYCESCKNTGVNNHG